MLVNSCSLKENVYSNTTEEDITNAVLAENLLFGIYRSINTDGMYRQNLTMLFAMPTDELKGEGNSLVAMRAEAANAYGTGDSYVQSTWQSLYKAVYNANAFLETMDKVGPSFSERDRELAAIYVAEAHALRALTYFELVRWFGHVPLFKTTADSYKASDAIEQAPAKEVYEFIEEDLKYAIDNLPWAGDKSVRKDDSFRFNKGAAMGLLAKVYATWAGYPVLDTSKWADAAAVAKDLIDSGKHGLLADYDQLWKNSGASTWDPTESLIELSYYAPTSNQGESGRVGKFNGVGGWGSIKAGYNFSFQQVVPTFISLWPEYKEDKRWAISFADYSYTADGKVAIVQKRIDNVLTDISFEMAMDDTTYGWDISWRSTFNYRLFPRKWDTEVYIPDDKQLEDQNYSNMNWYILRYADVLLLYAEAANEAEGAPSSDAYKAVDDVRLRAGLPGLPAGLSQAEFRQAVRDERAHELCFEAHRRQDLVRWGIYYETILKTYQDQSAFWHYLASDYYIAGEYTKKNKNELLPIPQREIDLCSKMVQNEGWK